MAGLVDGLGFEELGDAVDTGSKASQLWITGSVTSDSQLSGLNVFGTGSVVGARIENVDGLLPSHSTGSPASYGMVVQAGAVTTDAGSAGVIEFGRQFSSISWYVSLTGGSDVSDKAAYISGIKNVSGCDIVGEASIEYDYSAVGPVAS